jgi:hypothetical protein
MPTPEVRPVGAVAGGTPTNDEEDELMVEVEWLAAGGPDEPIEVPYSYTCDAGDCDNETVMIIKTLVHDEPLQGQDAATMWLSVCRKHSKAEMDHASLMLGRLSVVVIRPDLATTEMTEG